MRFTICLLYTSLEVNRAVEIIEEITPALKDRGLIFVLGELIVDVLKLNGLCVYYYNLKQEAGDNVANYIQISLPSD